MKHAKKCRCVWIILASAVICFSGDQSQKPASKEKAPALRSITDMAGRKLKVPEKVSKVLCTSPPLTTAAYIVAPD
jgi:ABC-type Fe3+-hydroxamate transport system substrate-binding protein